MLVADLLLSGPPLPGVTASVPTTDDLSAAFPFGSSIVPRELCQKIAVVSEDLVVGWAGGYDTARAVIGELRRLESAQRFTNESLQRHLESLDPSVWAESGHPDSIGLVGFIRDPDRRLAQFGRSYFKLDTQLFGKVGLLGSGLDDFEKFLQQTQELPEIAAAPGRPPASSSSGCRRCIATCAPTRRRTRLGRPLTPGGCATTSWSASPTARSPS